MRETDVAWLSGDFDRALRLLEQGITLAPNEPALWANKTSALMQRARIRYYNGNHSTDEATKKELIEAARSDVVAADDAAARAVGLMAALPVRSDGFSADVDRFHRVLALKLKAQASYLRTRLVDESYVTSSLKAYEEYLALETNPKEKLVGQLHAGEMLIRVRRHREAADIFRSILITEPSNAEANLGAGVALINLSFEANEKSSLAQGLDYLSRFLSVAPEGHHFRGSAEQALNYLRLPKAPLTYPAGKAEKNETPVTEGVMNGKALRLPQPPYPAIAQFARAQGHVPVRVLIDEAGNVVEAQAESGHPLLQAAAVAAARQATFSPTLVSGRAVKVMGLIVFRFTRD